MVSKSITQQIFDSFLEELSKNSDINQDLSEGLKLILQSEKPNKASIRKLLSLEGDDEDS